MIFNLNPFNKKGKFYAFFQSYFRENTLKLKETEFLKINTHEYLSQILMKINTFVLFLAILISQVNANSFAQQITLSRKKASLTSILKDLEKQSGYTFFFKKNDVESLNNINAEFKSTPLNSVLTQLLKPKNLTFEYFEKTIVIKKKEEERSSTNHIRIDKNWDLAAANVQQTIKGKVIDESGNPVFGATIRQKNNKNNAVVSNKTGEFVLPLTALNEIFTISFLGFENLEFKAELSNNSITYTIKKDNREMDEVVVTGMMNFKKGSFSGASSTFTIKDLKQVANTNIIQAVKALDPSFLVMENNLSGSNPNVLPNIELRGQTSISSDNLRDEFTDDPNQPLFILDGFQSSLRAILDLDMNRIESITILKDASSTAIYGSRASNGVVVVETIKPKEGEIRLNYTTDLNMEIADLGSYNMMNAAEKLEFERLSGVYTASVSTPESQQSYYDPLYNSKLERVLSGVNTYWMKTPIRTGFAHRQSLYVEGGSENFVFNVGGNYKNHNAVMKNSGRKEWGSRMILIYRKGKLSATNNLTIEGNNENESNYGSFATWVNLNPYYSNLDPSNPHLDFYRDELYGKEYIVYNPLYNSSLTHLNNKKELGIINNFQLNYDFNPNWKFQSSIQIKKNTDNHSKFISPLNTQYFDKPILERGRFDSKKLEGISYTANAMISYAISLNKHSINANGRVEFAEKNNTSLGFVALGFPYTSNGNPAFAYGYEKDGAPLAFKTIGRRNSFIGTLNYSFDQRYNSDFSFNYDGSTSFGRKNVYSPFYSVGGSWNMHNEPFLKGNSIVNQLKLRGNIGVTGNQNFSNTTSISTYIYPDLFNYFGQGISLATFGNENLKWQKTKHISTGIDAIFFNNKFYLTLNAYSKFTHDLAVAIDLPASTGLVGFPFNAGDLEVKGIELMSKYTILSKPEKRLFWNIGLTAARSQQTYKNFNSILARLNNSLQQSQSLIRYMDGFGPNDLWAIQSLGIDPASGHEIFLKKDGTKTFDYDPKDIVSIGNGNPLIQGVFNTNFNYEGFNFGIYMRYIWDQDILNSALFEKVENISLEDIITNNQDKRALYNRWKKPGDNAQFRSISLTSVSQPSSRFIQQENSFSIESVSLGYDFREANWLKKSGLTNLKITGLTNELLRWSTIRRERGISYPYARTFALTINANF
ncbi:SusC/RagA family TonB-linked outer membrane protein [Sphingobacterium sp. HJSM2_6]|uniref:SusC/RagA family TonB-linked outer membrane protein n=1 Tax=Sphingobacterium sp. HJSM2_6 TaxID=3366264 RepID=UPI003BD8F87D